MFPTSTVTDPVSVLVVAQNDDFRGLLAELCAGAGYAVNEASNGLVALDCLRATNAPMVVILDWWMPRVDGFELLREVAADHELANRHVFLLLSATDTLRAPVLDRIPSKLPVLSLRKPFDMEVLHSAVGQLAEVASAPRPLLLTTPEPAFFGRKLHHLPPLTDDAPR